MPVPVLLKAGEMLGSPWGSFAYHLLLLLAVEATFGMALAEWRSTRQEQARRTMYAASGWLLVRLAYVLVTLLTLTRLASPSILLPPLERAVDIASLCLIAWMSVHLDGRGRRAWDLVLGANLALALVVGSTFTILWGRVSAGDPALDYALFWQPTVWYAWQMVLALAAGVLTLRNRGEGSSFFLAALVFLFLGALLQLAAPVPAARLPIWARLANLVAYPLTAVAVYQGVVTGLRHQVAQLQEIGQASLDQIKSLLLLVDATRQVSASLSLPAVLDNAVRGVARALDADQCAIVLPEEVDPNYMRLAALYNPARQGRSDAATFPLEYQLTIQQAMRRKRYVTVDDPDNVQLRVLFTLLGSSESGPLLVQPLVLNGEALGAILVGNSRSRRPLTANEAKLCQAMAEHLVVAIQNAQRHQAAQDRIKELHRSLDEKRHGVVQPKPAARGMPERVVGIAAGLDEPGPAGTVFSG
jgi:hypothetical protein